MSNNLYQTLRRNVFLLRLSSLKITVVCLGLLFILTFWGTLFQVDNGIYIAQERFFNAWYFLAGGFAPFPGARLVLWVMFFNLLSACVTRLHYNRSNIGLIMSHSGLLLFFIASFVTFHGSYESNVSIFEGSGINVGASYHDWELSVSDSISQERDVYAWDVSSKNVGESQMFFEETFSVDVKSYYRNSEAFTKSERSSDVVTINDSGIKQINPIALDPEYAKNIASLMIQVSQGDNVLGNILLYGLESQSTKLDIDGQSFYFQLRRRLHPLPFVIHLKDFKMKKHPNTGMAKSYESLVSINPGGGKRDVLISMNKPLRYKNFTIYQASYLIDEMGRERSTLAVVENFGRSLPYIASFVTFAGLLWHSLAMAVRFKKKKVIQT